MAGHAVLLENSKTELRAATLESRIGCVALIRARAMRCGAKYQETGQCTENGARSLIRHLIPRVAGGCHPA